MPYLGHPYILNPSRSHSGCYVPQQTFVPLTEVPRLPLGYYQHVHSNHQQNVLTHQAPNVNPYQQIWQYPMSRQPLASPFPQDKPFYRPHQYLDVVRANGPFPPVNVRYPNPSPRLPTSPTVPSVNHARSLCIRESPTSPALSVDHTRPTHSSKVSQHHIPNMLPCSQTQQPQFTLAIPRSQEIHCAPSQPIPTGALSIQSCLNLNIVPDEVYRYDHGLNKSSTKSHQNCIDCVFPSVSPSDAMLVVNPLTAKMTESVTGPHESISVFPTDSLKFLSMMTGSKLATTSSRGFDDLRPLVASFSTSTSCRTEEKCITSSIVSKKAKMTVINASSVLSSNLVEPKAAPAFPSMSHNSETKTELSPMDSSREVAIPKLPLFRNIAPKLDNRSPLLVRISSDMRLSCRSETVTASQYNNVDPEVTSVSSQVSSHSGLKYTSSFSSSSINSLQTVEASSFGVATSVNHCLSLKSSSDAGLKVGNRPTPPPNVGITNIVLHKAASDEISVPFASSHLPLVCESLSSSASGYPPAINKSMLVSFPSDTRVSVSSLIPSIDPLSSLIPSIDPLSSLIPSIDPQSSNACVSASVSTPVHISHEPVICPAISQSPAVVPTPVPKPSSSPPLMSMSSAKTVCTSTLNSASDAGYISATPQSIFSNEAYNSLPFAHFFDQESDKTSECLSQAEIPTPAISAILPVSTAVPSSISTCALISATDSMAEPSVSVVAPSGPTYTSSGHAIAASPASSGPTYTSSGHAIAASPASSGPTYTSSGHAIAASPATSGPTYTSSGHAIAASPASSGPTYTSSGHAIAASPGSSGPTYTSSGHAIAASPASSGPTYTSSGHAIGASPASFTDKKQIESKLICTKLVLTDSKNFESSKISSGGNDTLQKGFVDASDFIANLLTLEGVKDSPTDQIHGPGMDSSPKIYIDESDQAANDMEMEDEKHEEEKENSRARTVELSVPAKSMRICLIDDVSGEEEYMIEVICISLPHVHVCIISQSEFNLQEELDTSITESCPPEICPEDEDGMKVTLEKGFTHCV